MVGEAGQVPPVVRFGGGRCTSGHWGCAGGGGLRVMMAKIRKDGVPWGLRSSPSYTRNVTGVPSGRGARRALPVRKGICPVDGEVWHDAQAGQLCFPREVPRVPFSSAHGWRGDGWKH